MIATNPFLINKIAGKASTESHISVNNENG